MIKGLQVLMARMETVFTDAIRRNIYQELQDFVQLQLRDPLRKSIKNKKDLIRSIIVSVRECCADWIRGIEPHDDPALKGKKDPDGGYDLKVNMRPFEAKMFNQIPIHTLFPKSSRFLAATSVRAALSCTWFAPCWSR